MIIINKIKNSRINVPFYVKGMTVKMMIRYIQCVCVLFCFSILECLFSFTFQLDYVAVFLQVLMMGKIDSNPIDSRCRIIMKNFDSIPQLQCFGYVHHCAARSRQGSHSRQCRHSVLQRQLAALLQCGPVSHGFGGLVQQLQDQSREPLVWTV